MKRTHCVKIVHIWSYSYAYSVRMWQNTDQNDSEYGHFLRLTLVKIKSIMANYKNLTKNTNLEAQ